MKTHSERHAEEMFAEISRDMREAGACGWVGMQAVYTLESVLGCPVADYLSEGMDEREGGSPC